MCAGACVFILHPSRQQRFTNFTNTSLQSVCAYLKIKSLKWFLHDLSQQRGQEKSIPPSLLPPSPLFPQLSSHLPSVLSLNVLDFRALALYLRSLHLVPMSNALLPQLVGFRWICCLSGSICPKKKSSLSLASGV